MFVRSMDGGRSIVTQFGEWRHLKLVNDLPQFACFLPYGKLKQALRRHNRRLDLDLNRQARQEDAVHISQLGNANKMADMVFALLESRPVAGGLERRNERLGVVRFQSTSAATATVRSN